MIDIDREIIDSVAPGVEWLVDLRVLIVLAFLTLSVVLLRPGPLWFAFAYVVGFPFVVLLWKVPKRILKLKSWVAAFAAINAVTALVTNLRYVLVTVSLALIAALSIVLLDASLVLVLAASTLGILLAISFARTIMFSLRPSRFIEMQKKGIARVVESDTVDTLTTPDEAMRDSELVVFDDAQQQQFSIKCVSSVAVHRALYFWGYQLDQYRQSSVTVLYSSLSYLWLLVQAVFGLALINAALYKFDSDSFSFGEAPTGLVFARYSFSSLTGGEINALQAHGDAANAVSLGSTFLGIGILAGLLLTIVLSFRKERQDAAIRDCLVQIDRMATEFETRHRDAFEVSLSETLKRLEELGYSLLGVVRFFTSRVPPDWKPSGGR